MALVAELTQRLTVNFTLGCNRSLWEIWECRGQSEQIPKIELVPGDEYLYPHSCSVNKGLVVYLQDSCLENPMDGGAWWAADHEVAENRTRLSDFTLTFHFRALEKEMATHSSVPAWRIPGTGKPGGLPSMGSHRVGHNWSDLAVAAMIFPSYWGDGTCRRNSLALQLFGEL